MTEWREVRTIPHFHVAHPIQFLLGRVSVQITERYLGCKQRLRNAVLATSWIELRTKRESLLQVLDEDANFGGHPAAGRPHGKDWHCSFKGRQKTENSTFSEFCGEEPGWRLGNP